jgi:hypothetical protein
MKNSLNPEQLRLKEIAELREFESNLSELELQFKEKWYACKDFTDGNDSLKMNDFQNWVKNVYKKQKSSFELKIKNRKEKYGII